MSRHRLLSIRFSHYNEKARWALDHLGVQYAEEAHLPGFHMPFVWAATQGRGRGDRVATKFATPVLVTAGGSVLQGSPQISRYAADSLSGGRGEELYPAAVRHDVEATEDALHANLGPLSRRVAYSWMIDNTPLMMQLARDNASPVEAALFRLAWPAARRMLGGLGLSPAKVAKSTDLLRREVGALGDRLGGDPGAYLLGATFTAADMSAACMLVPVLGLRPGEGFTAARLPSPAALPAEAQRFITEMRASVAGRYALRVFQEHRRAAR